MIEATLDCLHEGGLAAVGVRAVCSRAQLTPRYFYENFVDLDELLIAAVAVAGAGVSERILAAVAAAGDSTEEQVRVAVAMGFGAVADDPRAASAFLAAAGGQGPLRERRHVIVAEYADLVLSTIGVLTQQRWRERTRARATAVFLIEARPTCSRRCCPGGCRCRVSGSSTC